MSIAVNCEPTLPQGFLFRPATMADLETAVDLFNICSQALIGTNRYTTNEICIEWQTPAFHLEESTRVVLTPEGKMVGYIQVWDIDKIPVKIWVWGRVHPHYEGRGIGTYLMQWGEQRARQALDRVPDGVRVIIHTSTVSTYLPTKQLLEKLGMQQVRHFWYMVIDLNDNLPRPHWPPHIAICTYEEVSDLHRVYRAYTEAFQDHWGYSNQSEEEGLVRWHHWLNNDEEFDPSLWFIAMAGDEIAGLSLCTPKARANPQMGHVNILGVRRPWRRQGLALALLHHTFAEFHRRGQKGVGLGVDATSLTGATHLYKKAGMRVNRQVDTYEKEIRPGQDITTQVIETEESESTDSQSGPG